MKKTLLVSVLLSALIGLIVACAPARPVGTPIPPTPPVATAPLTPPKPAQTLSSEDIAWQIIVEAAKKEGKVSLYSFSMTGDIGSEIKKAFEEAYGIKVEITTGVGAILMERIKSERAAKKPIADTYDTAPGFVITAKKSGLTQPSENLPVLADKNIWRMAPHDGERNVWGIYASQRPPQINTALVKPGDEPKSYAEMITPKWSGKIVIAPPLSDPSVIYLYVAGKKYGFLNDDYFRQLGKQNLKIVPAVRDVVSALARSEASLTPAYSASVAAALIAEGAPVRSIDAAEGVTVGWGTAIAIAKDGPHPNAANVFLNWLFSKQGQEVYGKGVKTLPIRNDLPFYGPAAAYVEAKKTLSLELADLEEVSRLQTGQVVDKLLGLEVK